MKKSNAKVTSSAVAEVKKESKVIALASLDAASWNVHAAVKDKDEAIQGLSESMKANGLLHAVVVMSGANGRYTIIDGHRRVQAAKIAGWKDIDCVVRDVDERSAMVMTVSANLQRLENDPIKEAEAFFDLKKNGSTAEEIAASIGKEARYVIRRVQLTELDKVWKKAAKDQPFTVDALERISAYDKKVQALAFKNCSYELKNAKDWGEPVAWRSIKRTFESQTRELSGCPFSTKECAACPRNTANHGCLFPDLEGAKFGTCTDVACFKKKWSAAIDAKVADLRGNGVSVKSASSRWSIRGNVTDRKTKVNTVPYLVEESGLSRIYWGENPKASDAVSNAMTAEEREAEKEQKRKEKEEKAAFKKANDWFIGWVKSAGVEIILEMLKVGDSFDPVRVLALAYALKVGFYGYGTRYGEVSPRRAACLAFVGTDDDPTDNMGRFYACLKRVLGDGYFDIDEMEALFTILKEQVRAVASAEDFAVLEQHLALVPSVIQDDAKDAGEEDVEAADGEEEKADA